MNQGAYNGGMADDHRSAESEAPPGAQERWVLEPEDARAFLEALREPPEPNAALLAAHERSRGLLD